MARTKISEFSATPGNNTDIDGINIAEGCAPSGINDAIRELMSQLKDFQAGTAGDSFNGPVGTTTAAAGAFTTLTTSSTVTHNGGTANGVAYLNGSKVLTTGSALTFDGTVLNVGSATFPSGRIRLKQADDTSKQKGLLIETAADDSLLAIGYNSGAFTYNATYNTTGSYQPQAWWVNGSEQMRLTSTGLGIGTSSPGAKLEIYRTSSSDRTTLTRLATINNASTNNPYTGFGTGLLFKGTDYANAVQSFGAIDAVIDAYSVSTPPPDTGFGAALTFSTGTNGALTERMRLSSSGNLGLGVTPSAWSLTNSSALQIRNAGFMGYSNSAYFTANAYNSAGTWKYIASAEAGQYAINRNVHEWYIAGSGTAGNAITFTQAMTLDASGDLFLGTTTTPSSSEKGIRLCSDITLRTPKFSVGNVTTNQYMIEWVNGNGIVGSVSTSGTATAYNTSSDYRLKNNQQPLTGSGEFIDALQPKTWEWKTDGSKGVGFIAHEVQAISPGTVVGIKDAVDEEGKPIMQAMEYGSAEFIANIIAELQSLRKRVAALESK